MMDYEYLYKKFKQDLKNSIDVNTTDAYYSNPTKWMAKKELLDLMNKIENDYKIQSLENAGYFPSTIVNSSSWTGR